MPPSYRLQWLLAVSFALCAIWALSLGRRPAPAATPVPPGSPAYPHVGWYQIVGLPELPSDPALRADYRHRLGAWLMALRRERFVLLPLGQVLDRLERGELVPERTAVLLFEPGYRSTYEAIGSLFEDLEAPAVWLTQDPGGSISDRRFVSAHLREIMRRDGLWDVGLRRPDTESFTLDSRDAASGRESPIAWAADAGHCGVNVGGAVNALNRLNANRLWSAEEFMDRLLAEVPLQSPTPLTARMIQGRLWGAVPRRADARPAAFNLQADTDQRFASVNWLGARGMADVRVDFQVEQLYGQFWIMLRADPAKRHRVCVGFATGELRVDLEEGAPRARRASVPYALRPGAGVAGSVRLQGRRLEVECAGRRALSLDDVGVATTPSALLEVSAGDILPGAARATGVDLRFTPLPPAPPAPRPAAAEGPGKGPS